MKKFSILASSLLTIGAVFATFMLVTGSSTSSMGPRAGDKGGTYCDSYFSGGYVYYRHRHFQFSGNMNTLAWNYVGTGTYSKKYLYAFDPGGFYISKTGCSTTTF